MQEARLAGVTDVGLGAGVKLDGRQVEFEQPHVLHDERVHPGVVELPDQLARRFQLSVEQDGVGGDEDFGVIAVRVRHQARNVHHRVVRRRACAEGRAADIHRVCAVVDGFDAEVGGLRRGKELEGVAGFSHGTAHPRSARKRLIGKAVMITTGSGPDERHHRAG